MYVYPQIILSQCNIMIFFDIVDISFTKKYLSRLLILIKYYIIIENILRNVKIERIKMLILDCLLKLENNLLIIV